MDRNDEATRVIITVLGHDQVGIIAEVATLLAENQANILDISQTILQEFFTMIMIVDISKSNSNVEQIRDLLQNKGEEWNLKITVQHEDIFNYMHRI
jgi:ACT domain-containing protein